MSMGLRTHRCGTVRVNDVGQPVILKGWVSTRRDHGGVIFVDLRDHTGIVQVVFKPEVNPTAHKQADALRTEFVIAVRGKVDHREKGNVNPKLATGEIEVLVDELEILNPSKPPPFDLSEEVEERLRLKYRYLDLRRAPMQENLRLRSKAARIVRNYFWDRDFVEVETPVLTKATPEGARDYLVPSRVNPGTFYALPQSPQLYKQLLIMGGTDRYFQIVKCFRDEDLRGNRQPEFTQIDLELGFTEPEEIMELIDGLLKKLFKETIGVDVQTPIARMSYAQAIDEYGLDAPDIRYGLKLVNMTDIVAKSEFKVFTEAVKSGGLVKAIRVPGGSEFSRKELDELTEVVKIYGAKGMAWVKVQPDGWQSPIAKFFTPDQQAAMAQRLGLQQGDLAVFCADSSKIVHDSLGNLRKEIAKRQGLVDDKVFKFTWVTDFPMFDMDAETKRPVAMHHPFTSPVIEDLEKYGATDPLKIRARAYDIVLNGVEIGGGSIRSNRTDLQRKVFDLMGMQPEEYTEKFGFLLEALSFGAPPHGGIAMGFDRMIMFLVNTQSIRDVIAFPKTQRAADLMMDAPAKVDDAQLRELGIRLRPT
jgi:aspartyl-tRNA synthetase